MLPKPMKLLIVDDDASVRISLSRTLSELGYFVRSSADGFSGLSEIRKEIPDVLLSDLNMARMSGLDFLMVVRRWLPSIRVIALTRTISGRLIPPEIAADALFPKSADPARLIKTVDAMTRPKRPASRMSAVNSFGFQVLEAIPSHPRIEQLTFLAGRTVELPGPRNAQSGGIHIEPEKTRTQAASF